MDDEKPVYVMKIALCGEQFVGKTSIRRRYLGEGFKLDYYTTLGTDFSIKRQVVNGRNVELQIWDVAGQPLFKELRKKFFIGVNGAILVFDLTNPDTLHELSNWITELFQVNIGTRIPIVLVGNKKDLVDQIAVSKNDVKEFLSKIKERPDIYNQEIPYFETSALTGDNIDRAINELVSMILEKEF